MPFRNPPPSAPVRTYPVPVIADQVLIEWVTSEHANSRPLSPGTPHPNTRNFSGFKLGVQKVNPLDHNFFQRIWVTDATQEDTYNYAIKYSAEAAAYPIFVRAYREPKNSYAPLAKGTPLQVVYKLVLTNPGSGYTPDTFPAVTFDFGAAAAHGIVAPDGTIAELVLDATGDGYLAAPLLTVEDPPCGLDIGSVATGTAFIQPIGAVLVEEEAQQYPEDSEFYAQYFKVMRTYETLPGPTLTNTKLDDKDGIPYFIYSTRKVATDVVTGESIVAGTWCKTSLKQDDNLYVGTEIVQCRAIPGFPMESTQVDEDGMILDQTQTYTDTTLVVSEETLITGVWTRKHMEDVDGTTLVSWQFVVSRPIPGNPVVSTKIDPDGVEVTITKTLKESSTIVPSETLVTGVWTTVESEAVTDLVAHEVVMTRAIPGNPMTVTKINEDSTITTIQRTMQDQSAIVSSETLVGTVWTKTYQEDPPVFRGFQMKIGDLVAWEIIETRDIPGNVLTSQESDSKGIVHTIDKTLVEGGSITLAPSAVVDDKTIAQSELVDLHEINTAASLFADNLFEVEIPDPIPIRFRVVAPTSTIATDVVGTASMPSLGTGDLKSSEVELTEFVKRTSVTTRAGISLPVTLVSYRMTPDQQVETITETLDTGLQTLASLSALTVEADVQNLGNNTSLASDGEVPDVFGRTEYGINIPDPIPIRFRVVAPTSTTSVETAGTVSPPTLSTGDLDITESQLTEFKMRTRTVTRAAVSLPVSLVSYKLTPDKQIETITETLDTGLQTIAGVDALTSEAEVQNLGNNTSLLTFGDVPSVFGANVFGESIPDIIPLEFRAVVPTAVVELTTAGTAADPTLGSGDLDITETQLDEFRKRTRTVTRAGVSLPVSLVNKDTDKDKEIVTITTTLETAGTSTAVPDALTDVKVTNLGNSLELEKLDAVPEVFSRAEYSIDIPDPIPIAFRVVAPSSTTAIESAGTASMPSLGTGDLTASSRQINKFVKRDSVTTRSAISLPVTLVSYKLTPDKQIETITETLDTGLQTITGVSALTIEAEVRNLGNNTSLLSDGEVPSVFGRAVFEESIPDVIPIEFRAVVPTATTELTTAGTASDPTLGVGDLTITETQEDEFRVRTRTVTRAGVSLPVSLINTKTDRDKQLVTETMTLETSGSSVAVPSALQDVAVRQLGNSTELETVDVVPEVFARNEFRKEVPDVVPVRFRVAVPIETTSAESAGTASMPSLGAGDLSASAVQVNEFVKRDSVSTRSAISLPVSLVYYKYTGKKQVETCTDTLDTGLQTITGAALILEASVDNLGDGTSLKTVCAVPSVFGETRYATEIPDVVPVRFRVAVPITTTAVTAAGSASAPSLGSGDLSASDEDTTEFEHRTSVSTRSAISLPVSLVSYKYTRDKQVETVTETLATGLQTITGSTTTVEASVDNLGDGTSLKLSGTVPSLFTRAEYAVEIPITIPEKFRPAVPISTVALDSAGTASAPSLSTGDFSIHEEQVDAFNIRTTTRSIGTVSLPVTLTSYRYRKSLGRIETIVETLDTGLQTLSAITALTTEADVQNLGNGTSLKTEATIPTLFLGKSSGVEITDIIPFEFRAVVPIYTTNEEAVGAINDPPTLGPGDLNVVETQIDDYTKRVKRITRDPSISLPVTISGGKELVTKFGVQVIANRVAILDVTGSQTIPSGFLVVEASIKEIGNGLEIATSLVIDGIAWPIVHSSGYDEEMQVHYDIEEQVVDAAYTDTITPFAIETHKNLDQWHARRRKVTKMPTAISEATAIQSQVFAPFQFPGTLDANVAAVTNGNLGFRQTSAQLVPQDIKKWWVSSPTLPIIPVDLIIPDSINIGNFNFSKTYHGVLHDDFTTIGTVNQFYPATTPSFTQYFLGTFSGSVKQVTFYVSSIGSGYTVGDILFCITPNGSVRFQIIDPIGVSGTIFNVKQLSATTGALGSSVATNATGGTGTGAQAVVTTFDGPVYNPGSRWIGNPKVVAANITPTEIPNLWKIQTRTIIMR